MKAVLVLLLLAMPAMAETFTEDFEGFNLAGFSPELKPDQSWYNYREGSDIGNVSSDNPIGGSQSFRIAGTAGSSVDVSSRIIDFDLEVPAQLTSFEFLLNGTTITENGVGSQQVVSIQSSAPARRMVEFYVFCRDASNPNGCDLRVRWEYSNTTGAVLVPASSNDSQFLIQVTPNWVDAEFCLMVDAVDDGCFPMLDLPKDVGRFRFAQYRADVPFGLAFDNWTVNGAINGTTTPVDGDMATGLKNFADDIRFRTAGSKFFLGLVIFIVLVAAVLVPIIALGFDNTITPALGFYTVLVALWLVLIEFWPAWMGIALIILVSALIALTLRAMIGIRNATGGPGIVVGSLGYFVIASTFLAFSGYAGNVITLPTGDLDVTSETTANVTYEQSIPGQILDCSIGIITLGFGGDCTKETQGPVIKFIDEVVDSIAKVTFLIFQYIKAAIVYLFQLLTFQLPIPVFFNMLIVLPPAAALATLAFQTIRGTGG